jgi:tetratricopeptide (TPR) repeat protein
VGVYNGIGQTYLKAKKYEKALYYSNIALEKSPNNEEFLIQRSKIFLEINEHQKAIEDLTNALE